MKDFHFGRDSGASGKVLVVANPLAGRVSLDNGMGDSEHPLLSELCEMLNRGGTEVSIVEEATAEGMASAVELHVSRSVESKNAYDAVVVVGGDGTVSVVAGVLARIGAPSPPGSSAVVNTPPDYSTGAGASLDYPTVADTPTGSPTSPTSPSSPTSPTSPNSTNSPTSPTSPNSSTGSSIPPLLVIPGGTGNSFYKAVWGDMEWKDVVSRLLNEGINGVGDELASGAKTASGTQVGDEGINGVGVRYIDLGWIEELNTTFILGASAGIFRDILMEATHMTSIPGRERYQQAAMEVLNTVELFEAEIRVDGSVLAAGRFVLVAVGGARYRGGILPILPLSELSDGLLDVCAVSAQRRDDAMSALLQVVGGEHIGQPGIFYSKGSTVEIFSEKVLPLEYDGEICSQELYDCHLKILQGVLPVISVPI